MRNPALVYVDDSLAALVHREHLLRIQTPEHLVPFQVACERGPPDLLVGVFGQKFQSAKISD